MQRREFLSIAGTLGLAAPAWAATAGPKAVAEGGPLSPPKDRPIQVAIAVGEWNTWIDFVGPQAVFETFRYDPETKTHKPTFKMYFVGESLDPKGHLVPDYTFDTSRQPGSVLGGGRRDRRR